MQHFVAAINRVLIIKPAEFISVAIIFIGRCMDRIGTLSLAAGNYIEIDSIASIISIGSVRSSFLQSSVTAMHSLKRTSLGMASIICSLLLSKTVITNWMAEQCDTAAIGTETTITLKRWHPIENQLLLRKMLYNSDERALFIESLELFQMNDIEVQWTCKTMLSTCWLFWQLAAFHRLKTPDKLFSFHSSKVMQSTLMFINYLMNDECSQEGWIDSWISVLVTRNSNIN